MSEGFVHSVKVPRLYKIAAKIVQSVQENGASLKHLLYQQRHTNLKGVYALASNTIRHKDELNQLIRKTQILLNEQRLDPWLARILITELIWGKQCLKSDSKPIKTILSYEEKLRGEMKDITGNMKVQELPRVLAAVITVNIIIAGYVYLGFQESDDPNDNPEERPVPRDDLDKKID